MLDPPSPSTIVATVPRWLGRQPITAETILVGLTDADDTHAVCLALHPDREPVDEVEAMRQLVVDGAEEVAVVVYTGAEDPATEHVREAMLRFLAAAAGRYGLNLLGLLVVVPDGRISGTPGYWRTLPDPTRFPLPTPTEET